MGVELRLPNITATSTPQQLEQVKSYLYQFAEQLNWALSSIESRTEEAVVHRLTQTSSSKGKSSGDPVQTFSDIKNLIIKSADIVNAYHDEISKRLEGVFVAEATFPNGTAKFIEETSNNITVTDRFINQTYTNNQQIIADELTGIKNQIKESNGYLKSGELYQKSDGTVIYGLEIGQWEDDVTFKRFARYTADGIELFGSEDQNNPVAIIEKYRLLITSAEITGNLILGGYEFDTSDGIAHKWVGRLVERKEG